MISLLCPTRGRPDNMRRFAESAIETAYSPSFVEIVWRIDQDDYESQVTAHDFPPRLCEVVLGARGVLSEAWNDAAKYSCGEILGHMGDDIVFRTPGWDERVEEVFDRYPDRIAFVHGRDGIHDERLGTHGFVSREWYEALGRMVPPYFSHDYNDTWLTDVADRIGRRVYLPAVLTEHLHPDVGKAPTDQTYRDHAEAGERDNVAALYASLEHERGRDAEKLRALLAATP